MRDHRLPPTSRSLDVLGCSITFYASSTTEKRASFPPFPHHDRRAIRVDHGVRDRRGGLRAHPRRRKRATQPASAVLISIRRPKTRTTKNKGENVKREKDDRAGTKAIVFPFSDAAVNMYVCIRRRKRRFMLLCAKWRGRSRQAGTQRLSLAWFRRLLSIGYTL